MIIHWRTTYREGFWSGEFTGEELTQVGIQRGPIYQEGIWPGGNSPGETYWRGIWAGGIFQTPSSTDLELKKENNSISCASFLDLYICIESGEFHTRLFDKWDNFGFDIVRMPFYCFNDPSKMFYGSTPAEFLKISRATSKIEDLSHNCKQLLSRMLKQNGQMRRIKFSLIKMIQRHQKVFIK